MSKQQLIAWFPALSDTNFEVVHSPDATTNCVGYVLGKKGIWSPNEDKNVMWRANVERYLGLRDHVYAYIMLFESDGYVVCGELWSYLPEHAALEPAFEKIALYVRKAGITNHDEFTHVAKQSPDGRWFSKIATHEVIKHDLVTLESRVDTPEYAREFGMPRFGKVALVMKRKSVIG